MSVIGEIAEKVFWILMTLIGACLVLWGIVQIQKVFEQKTPRK